VKDDESGRQWFGVPPRSGCLHRLVHGAFPSREVISMSWENLKAFTLEQWPILAIVGMVLVWGVIEIIASLRKKPTQVHQSVKDVLRGSRIIER